MFRRRAALPLVLGLIAFSVGCERSARSPGKGNGGKVTPTPSSTPTSSGPGGEQQAQAKGPPMVVLLPEGRDEVRIQVELARTVPEQTKGLMFRTELSPDAGMLFLFDHDEVHTFWMKNTLIPLDMVFITKEGVVAGVVENAEPQTLTARGVDAVSRHVLEVKGGLTAARGISAGTRVRFVNVPGY